MESHNEQTFQVEATEADAGTRLDKLLAAHLPDFSRSRIQSLVEAEQVQRMGGQIITSASVKVKPGEAFVITVPPAVDSTIRPVAMDLDIIHEDDDILIVNKPAGLTVHPAPGHHDDTLVNALLAHCKDSLSGIGGVARPGIVHRIDKDTSGLLVIAKHDLAHARLAQQLQSRKLKRIYRAICWGVPPYSEGQIEGNIGRSTKDRKKMAVVQQGGKPATTHFQVLEEFFATSAASGKLNTLQRDPVAAYLECELETGRTHQIRVHLAHHHLPLVGDPVYGKPTHSRLKRGISQQFSEAELKSLQQFNRQALHAYQLRLIHPQSKEEMTFEAPLPDDFLTILELFQHLK